jgi:alpha-mannosidase
MPTKDVHPFRLSLILSLLLLVASSLHAAEPATVLWHIGNVDQDGREFALSPNRYGEFKQDGFYAVGRSMPARDWPYVHPGPADAWAGGSPHTFTILFALKSAPASGDCYFRLQVVDAQSQIPPKLRLSLNGKAVEKALAPGGGDASIFGQPGKGKRQNLTITWPATALAAGVNELTLTTVSGSWFLYDALQFDAPVGLELTPVTGTRLAGATSPPVLVEREGRLLQTVHVQLQHLGADADAIVRVDGAPTTKRLRAGVQTAQVQVPSVSAPKQIAVDVQVGGNTIGSTTLTLQPVRRWVVYLLPHSHVDIGYTHVQTDVERAQWSYLEMAIDTARRTANNPPGARFKWNVEVLWAVDSYLRQASPEKQAQFLDAVKKGWVGLQALYGNELTGLCRPEELLRLVGYAQTLSQRVGQPIQSAMITDVPGYTWGMVPTFAHSGVKYFSIGPNGGDRIGRTIAAWGDKPFWWVGPNGQDKVLVWMTGTGYYQVFQSPDKLIGYLGQLESKGYPYEYVQVRHCLGDNGAPDVHFADKVKAWNETYAYPKLVIATSEEMFRDFEQRYATQLPTARGDFTPYWEDGAASSARETALNRASADRLTQAETLWAMLDPGKYPTEPFYQAWRNVVLYDEHTWGAHNSISEPDAPFVKSQWAIKQAFALQADEQSRQLLADGLRARGDQQTPSSAIDVINTTGFSSGSSLVFVPRELASPGERVEASGASGMPLPSQRLTSGELVFAPDCEALGVKRFSVSDGPVPAFEGARVEGNRLISSGPDGLSLRVDEKTGAISSLIFRGQELVNLKSGPALNEYLYLPGSDLKGLQRSGPVRIQAKERGPLIASLLVESDAPGCRKLSREIRLHHPGQFVEVINVVDKAPVRAKEGVHFGFGFDVPNATVRVSVPWGVVRPEADQIPGACKNWFTVERWVDVSNNDYGVTWVTPDAPLVQVGNITANLIGSLPQLDVWLEHIEPSPILYSWAMNNHWHTNYRADQEGPTVFRYLIFPHGRYDQAEATRRGMQASQPLLVTKAQPGKVPAPRLKLSNTKVVMTALKPAEDGKAWVLRLFGCSDRTETVKLDWADPAPKSIWLSDASERALSNAGSSIAVPANSIVTLRAELP